MEVLKTEKALQEYGTDKGVIVITTDPSKANEQKSVPDIYIDGKKATSEEVAALPANPKGYVEPDGTVQLITEEKAADKKEPVPFRYLGQKPRFNGGDANEFSKWVAANLKYPEKCRQSKVQGRVTLQFTITEKGEVTDVRVLRGVNEELDKEALRVVSASPRWTPGKDKNGNIVPVIFTFPVLFQL
jgi:protein TonB